MQPWASHVIPRSFSFLFYKIRKSIKIFLKNGEIIVPLLGLQYCLNELIFTILSLITNKNKIWVSSHKAHRKGRGTHTVSMQPSRHQVFARRPEWGLPRLPTRWQLTLSALLCRLLFVSQLWSKVFLHCCIHSAQKCLTCSGCLINNCYWGKNFYIYTMLAGISIY